MDPLDTALAALANPIRRRIIAHLSVSGEASVSELAQPFDVSLMAVSKHVHVLADSGLITMHKEGRMQVCRLNAERLKLVHDWMHEQWKRAAHMEDEQADLFPLLKPD